MVVWQATFFLEDYEWMKFTSIDQYGVRPLVFFVSRWQNLGLRVQYRNIWAFENQHREIYHRDTDGKGEKVIKNCLKGVRLLQPKSTILWSYGKWLFFLKDYELNGRQQKPHNFTVSTSIVQWNSKLLGHTSNNGSNSPIQLICW